MLTVQNMSRGDKFIEDFPSGNELLFPLLYSDCKAALNFREAHIYDYFPQFLPRRMKWLKWHGCVNKSWGILLHLVLPLSLKTVWREEGWSANPFTFCCFVILKQRSLGCICRCWGFHLLTFQAPGFPWCLRNVQTVSKRALARALWAFPSKSSLDCRKSSWTHTKAICLPGTDLQCV